MKIKGLLSMIALITASFCLNGQSVSLQWAKQMGGSDDDFSNSIAVHENGNVYTTGSFKYTSDFDPGPGTYNLTSEGYYDIFISKLDAYGNFGWAKQIGGTFGDSGLAIALNDSGIVFVSGYFTGTVDFDPGSGTHNLTSAGAKDMFILKLDNDGNFVWVRQISGPSGEIGRSISLDNEGNIYSTGDFSETVDFDPGSGTYYLTSNGLSDIFVLKLDASGNFVWAAHMGGDNWDYGSSVSIDGDGNVYTTGSFKETADFDPGSDTYYLTGIYSNDEIFISKLDASGNFVWARHMGGEGNDNGQSIVVDTEGTVYTTGHFEDTADFNPDPDQYYLTPLGEYDIYISKLDSSGNFVWARQMGGTSFDYAYSIALDKDGNVYTTGGSFISSMSYNIIFAKLDASGNFIWMEQTGGWLQERGFSIALDSQDNIYITGYFMETCDFIPGSGTYNLISAGLEDVFVMKLTQTQTNTEEILFQSGIRLLTSCHNITVDGLENPAIAEVFDITGKSLGQWKLNGIDNYFSLNQNLGIYLVRISSDNVNVIKKIFLK